MSDFYQVNMSKKALIVSYYWPPAGGPGVQRWLKFGTYLPDFDIEPIMYVPEKANYPIVDAALLDEIPQGITVLHQKIKEPYKWASYFSKKTTKSISSGMIPAPKKQSWIEKTLLFIRGNFFIPDARVGWVTPSIAYLTDYIEHHHIDFIITTGPPHSMHLIGMALNKRFPQLRWIADFRDPWTRIGYHKALKLSKRAEKKHLRLEKKVLTKAHHILVTSPSTKKEFEKITMKPITVITNGYDVMEVEKRPMDEKFSLSHIGSLLADRNPRVLWKAIADLVKEHPDFKAALEIKLIGKVSPVVLNTLKEFKLDPYVKVLGYVSHQEALIQQRCSQVLLLIEIDAEETVGIIPGKLFEYMAAERPILGIGPENADFAKIMTETNTGVFCQYDEKEKIKETLWSYYEDYKRKKLRAHAVGLQYYSRKKLTEKLANVLHHIK